MRQERTLLLTIECFLIFPAKKAWHMYRNDIRTEEIVDLYKSGLISREISNKLDCSVSLVQQRLAKVGMKMRSSNERKVIDIDSNILKEMYWDKKMHPVEIGKVLGIHKNTVTKKMREFDIPLRTKSEARIKELNPIYNIGHSKKTKEKMSRLFLDGHRKISFQNRFGKKTEYKDVVFRSMWEYGFAVFLDNYSIEWQYEPCRFKYVYRGHNKIYVPDFYLPKGFLGDENYHYVEIKGCPLSKKPDQLDVIKAQVEKLIVLKKEDLIKLDIINKAGKVIIAPNRKGM